MSISWEVPGDSLHHAAGGRPQPGVLSVYSYNAWGTPSEVQGQMDLAYSKSYVQYVQKSYVPHRTAQPGHCVILTQHMRSDLWEKGRTDPYLCKTKTTRNDLWVMFGLKQVLDRREEERATGSPKREVRSPSITESHSKGALVYHLLSVPHSSLRLRPRWLSILSLNDCFSLPPPPEWVPHNQAHQTTTQKPVSVTFSSEWK